MGNYEKFTKSIYFKNTKETPNKNSKNFKFFYQSDEFIDRYMYLKIETIVFQRIYIFVCVTDRVNKVLQTINPGFIKKMLL